MHRLVIIAVLSLCLGAGAQIPSVPTELGASPFVIQNHWVIGGKGTWNSLVVDTTTNRLLIAHHNAVQAVDLESGKLTATLDGFIDAHSIAFDASGSYGFVSDAASNELIVFNRNTLDKVATIFAVAPGPVFYDANNGLLLTVSSDVPITKKEYREKIERERQNNLQQQGNIQKRIDALMAECRLYGTDSATATNLPQAQSTDKPCPAPKATAPKDPVALCMAQNTPTATYKAKMIQALRARLAQLKVELELPAKPFKPLSAITVINAQNWTILGTLGFPGYFGKATLSSDGNLYVASIKSEWADTGDGIVHLDLTRFANSPEIQEAMKVDLHENERANAERLNHVLNPIHDAINTYSGFGSDDQDSDYGIEYLALDGGCTKPTSLAVNSHHEKLFVGCGNDSKINIFSAQDGRWMQTFDAGYEVGDVQYDEPRNLLFAASSFGSGQLTVIREHITDSYAVVQNLPTMDGAGHMAVDPATGRVYLVSTPYSVSPGKPTYTHINSPHYPPMIDMKPIDASFQVLVVGQ
jgi:DNA-binding beta-propeller fold protein YncE